MKLLSISQLWASSLLQIGDQVTVDGMQGRGVVIGIKGKRVVIRFRSGEYLSRDKMYVNKIEADYKSPYHSGKK